MFSSDAAGRTHAFLAGCETLGGEAAIFRIQHGAENNDLSVKPAAEIFLVVLQGAGTKVGKGKGRNVIRTAFEIQGHGVGDTERDAVARQRGRSVRAKFRRRIERAGGEFDGHAGHGAAIDGKRQRHPPNDVVAIGVDIQGPDILLLPNGDPLAGRGPDGLVAAQDLAEHDLARGRRTRQRTQKVAVEAADLFAQHAVAERYFGLFDRGRDHHVEAGDFCAAFEDGAEHAADLAGPGQRRRALEGSGAIALFIDRDHDRGRFRRIVRLAKGLPAQRRQDVDRQAVDAVECGRD